MEKTRELPNITITDKQFWINQWEIREKQAQSTINKAYVTSHLWDKLSKKFSQKWKGNQEDLPRDEILPLLTEQGINLQGIKILDLGCGTGRFTIPFARMGANVTAIDISREMLRCLEEAIPSDLSSRISLLQMDWHEANLEELGLRSAFDLSFAHMTPAITGPETFLKFAYTSRKWGAFVGWSGERKQNLVEDVWRYFTGKELAPQRTGDIIYPFNLMYFMGYRPFIDFYNIHHEDWVAPESEAEILGELFHEHLGTKKEELYHQILSYLEDKSSDGKIKTTLSGCLGRMIWSQ